MRLPFLAASLKIRIGGRLVFNIVYSRSRLIKGIKISIFSGIPFFFLFHLGPRWCRVFPRGFSLFTYAAPERLRGAVLTQANENP